MSVSKKKKREGIDQFQEHTYEKAFDALGKLLNMITSTEWTIPLKFNIAYTTLIHDTFSRTLTPRQPSLRL
jgi:hypothetical protein